MERILTVSQMRNADEFTIKNLGISKEELVMRAGVAVADEVKNRFFGGRVLVCVGKGNNGQDGLIVADILSKTHGYNVTVFNVENGLIKVFDKEYDIVIDCIFGTGLNKDVEGIYKTIIEKINSLKAFVISCDIASGINGDNGKVMGVAVKADLTIAIQDYKVGHFMGDGIDYSGEVVCCDIGISVWDDNVIKRIDNRDAKKLFLPRNRNVNKGNFGKSCMIGGSRFYSGSILLSANALCALKSGAGYSYLTVPASLFGDYVGKNPECILMPIDDDGNAIVLDKETLDLTLKMDSIAIGMGMTDGQGTYDCIEYLLKNYTGKLLIDADGLNALSKFGKDILKQKKCEVILTPHIGEFARLLDLEKQAIMDDIMDYALNFAKEYNVILAVKSAVSIITDGNEIYLNTTGCSGMAKAGSGDVLSGFAAGILARSEDALEAMTTAMYIFGMAGELAQKQDSEFTITASDIIAQLPKVINSL